MATKKSRKAKKANGKATGNGAAPKPRKTRTAKVRRGGGKALSDFTNENRLRVLKPRLITRTGCFKNNQTIEACLAAQKAKGFRGRRKFIRTQISAGRVALK